MIKEEIFKTKPVAWIGQKPIGRGVLREWMRDIERRVERLEKACGEKKQLKLREKP